MGAAHDVDLIIAGQGFAGSALAMAAAEAGLRFLLADPAPDPGATASRVAAGLITPLAGKRIGLTGELPGGQMVLPEFPT